VERGRSIAGLRPLADPQNMFSGHSRSPKGGGVLGGVYTPSPPDRGLREL